MSDSSDQDVAAEPSDPPGEGSMTSSGGSEPPPSDASTAGAERRDVDAGAAPASDGEGASRESGESSELDAGESDAESASAEPPDSRPSRGEIDAGESRSEWQSRALRAAFWGLWFILVPLALASGVVWALSPNLGEETTGILGMAQSIVREQPVPIVIVLFTVFEMTLWAARERLPLAVYARPERRADVPDNLLEPYERARALLDEADHLLTTKRTAIERLVSKEDRQKLEAALDELAARVSEKPFESDGFVDALVKADGEVDVHLARWRKSELREYGESIAVALIAAMILRAFVIEAFKIPSGSMIPTLQIGDHIFVNKLSYGLQLPATSKRVLPSVPHRGDVMVFAFPENPEQDFIKRVIALPGDVLEARGGHPWINGWEVPNCRVGEYGYADVDVPSGRHDGDLYVEYLGENAYLTLYDRIAVGVVDHQGPYYVPTGQVYVMGDNRHNSHDSRMWWGGQGGGVPLDQIRGRALVVWLSVGEAGMDWSRVGLAVMGEPWLPTSLKHLEPGLIECLKKRPPLSDTTPPAAK